MSKSNDAFRTISEVAKELGLATHVLRFWESKFPQIKPLKRAGGRRYYRPDDVLLLRRLQTLLHDEGYTIKGVQKVLREEGSRKLIDEAASVQSKEKSETVPEQQPDDERVEPQKAAQQKISLSIPVHPAPQASLFDAPASEEETQAFDNKEAVEAEPVEQQTQSTEDLEDFDEDQDYLADLPEPTEPINWNANENDIELQTGMSLDQKEKLQLVLSELKSLKTLLNQSA